MKNFTLGLALVFGGMVLTAACGDDSGDTAGSGGSGTAKGGSSGSGGSDSKGGTGGGTSKGGTSSSGGDTNTGNGGDTNTGNGGDTNTGNGGGDFGFGGGDFGFGGAFNNPEGCPATAPDDGDECALEGGPGNNSCVYEEAFCFCDAGFGQGGGAATGEFNCFDTMPGECPADPVDGEDCEGPIFNCNGCNCPNFGPDENTWVCQ